MNADGLDMFDLDTAARTVYGEARGEPYEGKVAVARVIVNRWKADREATLEAVCKKPKQFSCHNPGDPNEPVVRNAQWDDANLRACMRAVIDALDPKLPDPTMGSRHYCTVHIDPWWAAGRTPVCTIGNHKFFNDLS